MAEDVAAAVARTLEWEAARNRAAMEVARSRVDAAERQAQQEEEERRAQERPRPDPDVVAFQRKMTGQPPPLDLLGTLARHQAQAPAEDAFVRDPGAAYGSQANPERFYGESWKPLPAPPPPVQRSAGWEYELDQVIERSRQIDLFMIGYKVRRHGAAAVEAARRARDAKVSRSAAPDPGSSPTPYCRGCGALASSCRCRAIVR